LALTFNNGVDPNMMKHNDKRTGCLNAAFARFGAAVAVLVCVCLCGSVWGTPETVKKAAELVSAGQWDAALAVLQSDAEAVDPKGETLKGLLLEYQALQQRRQEQRKTVFEEKRKALAEAAVTPGDDESLLKAMELFKGAWDNATEAERESLLADPIYKGLHEAAHARFIETHQAGRWDAAWSKWLKWLVVFEPTTYRQASEDLQERRAMAAVLQKNPCDESDLPYARVKRETASRVFEILDAQYAEPVPYAVVAAKGLARMKLLPEVFGNSTLTFAAAADPNGFGAWAEHIDKLVADEKPSQCAAMTGLLESLLAINQTTLKLPEGVIAAQFTEAALTALDPYTEAVWPEGVGQFEKTMTGQFGGVGIRIKKDGEEIVVVSVIPDTPAAKTTLAADDIIVAVDGQATHEMTTDCAVSRISGPVGTAVSLTIRRAGAEKDELVTVTRQKIVLPTVEGSQRADNGNNQGHWDYFLDAKDRIGYLHLNGFTDKTAEQARQVLEHLEKQQVAGLIVDVRGNGGGLLSEATAFANLFVGDGVLLSSRGRGDKTTTWEARPNGIKRAYPIVLLIDEGSASASEIVAGVVAARKPGQATLIGARTYGKGTVQEVLDLGAEGGRLKLTTANYYLPEDRPVKNRYKLEAEGRTDWGIAPTIETPLYAYEQAEVRRIQLERRKQLMAKDTQKDAAVQSESLAQQMLMADAQLSAAVVVLKARILAAD
jgi:carboxyl-terminal processing protease